MKKVVVELAVKPSSHHQQIPRPSEVLTCNIQQPDLLILEVSDNEDDHVLQVIEDWLVEWNVDYHNIQWHEDWFEGTTNPNEEESTMEKTAAPENVRVPEVIIEFGAESNPADYKLEFIREAVTDVCKGDQAVADILFEDFLADNVDDQRGGALVRSLVLAICNLWWDTEENVSGYAVRTPGRTPNFEIATGYDQIVPTPDEDFDAIFILVKEKVEEPAQTFVETQNLRFNQDDARSTLNAHGWVYEHPGYWVKEFTRGDEKFGIGIDEDQVCYYSGDYEMGGDPTWSCDREDYSREQFPRTLDEDIHSDIEMAVKLEGLKLDIHWGELHNPDEVVITYNTDYPKDDLAIKIHQDWFGNDSHADRHAKLRELGTLIYNFMYVNANPGETKE